MPELHSVVCVKVVPKPEEVRVDEQTHSLVRAQVRSEINPPDMNAMEMALGLKDRYGGTVSILSMGPPLFEPYLRAALAMGADHIYLLSDPAFAGADTLATTYTLSLGVRKIGAVDLVFCGEESSDGATGQVPAGLAEWLDLPQLSLLTHIDLNLQERLAHGRRELKGGYEIVRATLPCVVSVKTAANEPRFIDYAIKDWAFGEGRITVWGHEALGAELALIGLAGSPTRVTGLAEAQTRHRRREFIDGDPQHIAHRLAQLLRDNN